MVNIWKKMYPCKEIPELYGDRLFVICSPENSCHSGWVQIFSIFCWVCHFWRNIDVCKYFRICLNALHCWNTLGLDFHLLLYLKEWFYLNHYAMCVWGCEPYCLDVTLLDFDKFQQFSLFCRCNIAKTSFNCIRCKRIKCPLNVKKTTQ